MCLVLDTNAIAACFNPEDEKHNEFRPVLEYLTHGKGKLVYGGKKYKKELGQLKNYLRLFASLARAGKIVNLDDKAIDDVEVEIKLLEPSKNFDDPHLVAIIIKSKCKIICTNDIRAMPYLKDSRFYSGLTCKPKLYTSSKNISLLTDKYIADICKPCNKLPKKLADVLL